MTWKDLFIWFLSLTTVTVVNLILNRISNGSFSLNELDHLGNLVLASFMTIVYVIRETHDRL